jgi:hypothetical protein
LPQEQFLFFCSEKPVTKNQSESHNELMARERIFSWLQGYLSPTRVQHRFPPTLAIGEHPLRNFCSRDGPSFKQENVLNAFPAMQFSEAMKPLGSEGEAGQ